MRTAALADSTAAPSAMSSACSGAMAPIVSTAILLATSPAAWPPMPSHTQNSGARTRKESSFWPRTRPTSERAPQERASEQPVEVEAPARLTTGISFLPGALTGSADCSSSRVGASSLIGGSLA